MDDASADLFHGVIRVMKHRDLFALCRAALETSPEPLDTCRFARYVIVSEGWDADDRRLRLAVAAEVGAPLGRMSERGSVGKAGMRDRATL